MTRSPYSKLSKLQRIQMLIAASGPRRPDVGHLYVVEFTSGVIKVGKAVGPKSRIASHSKFAAIHGDGIVRSWSSERHHGYSDSERDLITFCKKRGSRVFGHEYFRDVTFDDARIFAGLLAQRAVIKRSYAESADHLAVVEKTTATILIGCGGDLGMNAVEAYRRGLDNEGGAA